ncbi:hypothetical protein [Enterococcus termitis]|uniref:Uncharacterized protein n=1 Tax=Enterococcus termitis TaxID=332950 RepID=A0A1E5GJM5_9ENTE|nr:hypothetical protein [Enterococcus termitis]OEG12916.1 hypothetical protein BCR25_05350 [Enterococcus termitis]
MKKIRPQNPIYLILCIFMPWRYLNTYYTAKNDTLIISRYYARNNLNVFDRKIDKLDMKKLMKFCLPKELGSTIQEPTIHGAKGTYISQEIHFHFKDQTIVAWNVRPYTKKQIRQLAELIHRRYGLMVYEE